MKAVYMMSLAVVAALPPLLAWAVRGNPPSPPPPTAMMDDRWAEVPETKKQDQLPVPRTVLVKTVPITPPAPERFAEPARKLDDVVLVPPPEPVTRQRVKRTRERVRDVCARHGMRKVVNRGGKSWNCRR